MLCRDGRQRLLEKDRGVRYEYRITALLLGLASVSQAHLLSSTRRFHPVKHQIFFPFFHFHTLGDFVDVLPPSIHAVAT